MKNKYVTKNYRFNKTIKYSNILENWLTFSKILARTAGVVLMNYYKDSKLILKLY